MARLPENAARFTEVGNGYPPFNIEAAGERFGISRERVRQIEERALKKIRTAVEALAARPALPAESTASGV